MSLYNLDKVLKPAAVAVVGATDRPNSIGAAVVGNLIKGGFPGPIYPINPGRAEVMGLKAYASLSQVGRPIDLAVVVTRIETVPPIIRECGELKVGGVVIISAGGKESGPQGAALEAEILREARRGGVRIVGPNCMGVISAGASLNASFMHLMPRPGKLAFISQSGAICSAVLDFAVSEHMGFSYFISIGSMLDADFGDLIDYLGNDPQVESILLYVETINQNRKFMSAARAVSQVKPIVVLKAGKSQAGAKAAQSHTGSLAGEDAVYDAAFKRAGMVRVETLEDLFDCAELMAKTPRPKGPNLVIITNTGGPGVMAADFMAKYGLEPAPFRPETFAKIDKILPPIWSKANPIDMTGAAGPEAFRKVAEVCIEAEEFDAALVMTTTQGMFSFTDQARDVAEGIKGRSFPVFAAWMGGESMDPARKIFNEAGIPTYFGPEGAIRAFQYLYNYEHNLRLLQEVPRELDHPLKFNRPAARRIVDGALSSGHRLLTEVEAKELLTAYGIPTTRTEAAATVEEAVRLARRMGYPVAAKLLSRKITHKSDAGGIKLDLRNADEVIDAFESIREAALTYDPEADFLGVTIQPMIKEKGTEVILGSKKDPGFGPVILFGAGGIMTELFHDRAIGLPPLNRLLARRLIEETKIYKLLKGFRNLPPANLGLLEEILVRLSQLVIDLPEIVELDINPTILSANWAYAVDARAVLAPADKPSPLHLAVSTYPEELEMRVTTKSGRKLFIRPIRPEDAPLLRDLLKSLSQETIYHRFLRQVQVLDPEVIARLTQVDYDRELALVALDESGPKPVMVAVHRFMGHPDGEAAEAAIGVGDAWQGLGIGALLMETGIKIARKRGFKRLFGYCLPGNEGMLGLALQMGMETAPVEEGKKILLTLDLTKAEK